jgi:peptide deformylase
MSLITRLFPLLIIAIIFNRCTPMKSSLSLEITQSDIQVLQQVPQGDPARTNNPLYLPPRAIEKNEFKTKKLDQLIDTMYSVMLKKAGVGIAANQIGKRLQIFILEAKADNPRYKVLGPVAKQIFINPRITKVSEQRKNFWHGCLSADGKERGNVATYDWIEYECFDESGNLKQGKLNGFAAVIFQHEFRHLLAGTYLDIANHFLSKTELDYDIEIGKVSYFDIVSDTLPLLISGYRVGQTINDYHSKK